jgi:hypothetical protein
LAEKELETYMSLPLVQRKIKNRAAKWKVPLEQSENVERGAWEAENGFYSYVTIRTFKKNKNFIDKVLNRIEIIFKQLKKDLKRK